MDVGLRLADDYVLDKFYAWAFPSTLLSSTISSSSSFSSNLTSSSSSSSLGINNPSIQSSTNQLLRSLATYGHDPSSNSHLFTHGPSSLAPYQSLSLFPRDSIARQSLSLWFIAIIGAYSLYFFISTLSYHFLFDKRLEHHPRFIKNQVRKEIWLSVKSMPWIDVLIVPWWVAEIRGHSYLYDTFYNSYGTGPKWSAFLSTFLGFNEKSIQNFGPWIHTITTCLIFLAFTDYCIYWIHRWLHLPWLYKRLHKPHHRWLVPTPFAAMAFHPLDGYAQSLPYHFIICFLPINKFVYLGLFVMVNCWTIFIHDGDMISGHFLEKYINSPAHHTLHHLYFTCNYGQYTTFSDSWGGSYRAPRPDLDPIHDAIKNIERKRLLAEREERKAAVAAALALGEELVNIQGGEDVEASDSGYEGSELDEREVKVKKEKNGNGKGKKVEVFTESFRKLEPGKEVLRKRR